MKTTKEKIEVMWAYDEGHKIQIMRYNLDREGWHDTAEPLWNWLDHDYRIKPEPKVIWVNEYEGVCGYCHPDKSIAERSACGPSLKRAAVKYIEAIE